MARPGVWRLAVTLSAALLLASALAAQEVPRFAEVTGHGFGERITVHAEMVRFLERLAESSERVSLLEQGTSWEERRLLAAVVTSPENQARLEEIQANARRLGDPRSLGAEEARQLFDTQPAVVWLGGSIHGFELSGSEGLLKVFERLAASDEPEVGEILDNLVVIVDPMLNPDGRDAFAAANHEALGRRPVARRDHWGNDWDRWDALRFRTGHYSFDTNRDWFAHTQRETRQRAATIQAWRPQVVVDAHEMGPDAEFYFDPAAEPYGVYYPELARRGFERFHQAYAAAFDAAGFDYMSRERYNYFYPGYTTSWGSYQGAVGMLYEQGSSRGLALERADGTVRTLSHALEQQATAAWAALELAASERRLLLEEAYEAHRSGVEDGRRGVRRYLVAPGGDPAVRGELADLLGRNGIEVEVLTEAATLSGVRDRAGEPVGERSFAAGTWVIEAAQPRNRLIRALLEPHQPLPEDFLAEARARVERGENPRFYDITAWSLPLLFDLSGFSASDGRELPVRRLDGPAWQPAAPESAAYAYLFDGRQAAALGALTALKGQGLRAFVTLKPTAVGGRPVTSGTVIVPVSPRDGQPAEKVGPLVHEAAERFRLEVTPVDSGLTDPVPGNPIAALGSGEVIPVRTPEVALLAGPPVDAYSFGWAWYVLDRQYEIPLTVRRVSSLAGTPLDDFNVLVIPDLVSAEALTEAVGEAGLERLRAWVRDGGTLVVVGEAVELARKQLGLIALGTWYPEPPPEDPGAVGPAALPEEGAEEPARFEVPGAILAAHLDPEVWLSAGYVETLDAMAGAVELPVLVGSERIFTAPPGPPDPDRRVAARYADDAGGDVGSDAGSGTREDGAEGTPRRVRRLSGHVWPESLERLPGAVFAYDEKVGRGRVIAFAEDVNFRGYFRGADRLFLNAVVLGPSAP